MGKVAQEGDDREGEAPAEPRLSSGPWLGGSLALPNAVTATERAPAVRIRALPLIHDGLADLFRRAGGVELGGGLFAVIEDADEFGANAQDAFGILVTSNGFI